MNELETRAPLTIQDCMALVMGDVREVAKSDRNTAQNFSFRGVDAVVNAVAPALRKHGVIVTPATTEIAYEPFATTKGAQMMCARVLVTYRFTGPGGDFMEAQVAGEAFDSGDKATAKAMSVAFRTALLQALVLPTDDTDPDATSYQDVALASAAPGGSTANANTGQEHESAPSPRATKSGQAAQDAAPPTLSASDVSTTRADGAPAGDDSVPRGEGGTTPAGAPIYLSKDDQGLLATQYEGSRVKALKAYQAKFGSRLTRLGDITYDMRDEMEGANA